MNSTEDDHVRNPSSGEMEGPWSEKKEALLRGIPQGRSGLKIDRGTLEREKERVIYDIERLEEENHLMTRSARDFQLQLSEKRRKCQMLLSRSDAIKKKLLILHTREGSLQNEIHFYELEKAKLSDRFLKASEGLRTKISRLDSIVKDIDFMKGETETLIGKMGMLEREVPVKVSDVDNLNEKMVHAVKVLKDLYRRMQGVEKKIKINYYKKKEQQRSGYDYY